ncbi:MAG: sigma-70 family RNA polymerase sigma factor [Propionibacteriaceae bacterium]|nr:sigma-70 family RNA polymerase sigma factor [Propionibacteriaceae bacterium]
MDTDNATASEAEFRAWYQRTSPRVYAYVRRYCPDDDCDDVVAEVYLVAWTRLAELPSDAVPWLIGTARHVLSNSWRARGRRRQLVAELAGLNDLATADPAGIAVERADLLRVISRLRSDDQEVLLLAGWDGLDSAGIATVLGCSVAAARTRLSRARRRLVDRLNAPLDTPSPVLRLVPEAN